MVRNVGICTAKRRHLNFKRPDVRSGGAIRRFEAAGRNRRKVDDRSLTWAEAWTPCACSLQHCELMAQDNKFQQEVKALAEPRPHCRKPSKDPSRRELYAIR
jgi:hypothetical protein